MPTTRALSARQRSIELSSDGCEFGDEQAHGLLEKSYSSKNYSSFSRTSSAPSLVVDKSACLFIAKETQVSTETMTSFDTNSTQSSKAYNDVKSRNTMRSSLSSSSSTSTGSFCSSSRQGEDDDETDDEEERATRAGRARLSGCSRLSEAGPTRDDSNKENVPPLRSLEAQRNLQRAMAAQQEDSHVRRTRSRAAAPMSDLSDTASITSSSSRQFCRTVSLPVVTRKRSRVSYDAGRDLASPSSRPRLDGTVATPSYSSNADERDSYFSSSQATSIFDSTSMLSSGTLSRCTTPEPTEMGNDECGDDTYDAQALVKQLSEVTATDLAHERTSTEATPEPKAANVFFHARSLLRYGVTSDVHIVGRGRERAALQRFLQKRFGLFAHLEHSAMPSGDVRYSSLDGATDSGSLYVCGLPGTGKTALIRSVLAEIGGATRKINDKRPRVAFVDCMTVQHPRELFRRILQVLREEEKLASLPAGETGDAEAERCVTAIVKDASLRTLIVLDEIDHLLRSRVHQNILYRLFSWPQSDSQSCALIGIANSLDLTERFVPLLASKGAAPAVLNFRPFEADEIKNVIGARLALLRSRYDDTVTDDDAAGAIPDDGDEPAPVPLFMPTAFELMARRIAAATGDLRKALDASRLAVEAVEAETISKAAVFVASETTSNAPPLDLRQYTPQTAPKVLPSHILKVLSSVLGSPQLAKIRSLGLQHKLTLLALLICQKRSSLGLCVLGNGSGGNGGVGACSSNASGMLICDIESTYAAMLKNDDFAALESSELIGVMEGLEVEGVVHIVTVGGSSPGTPNGRGRTTAGNIGGVSPSAKRAAKRQLLASLRRMQLVMSADEILRGITTTCPAASTGGSGVGTSSIVIEAIKRIWQREEHNAERAKGWEALATETRRVRDEELGGGRGALGI